MVRSFELYDYAPNIFLESTHISFLEKIKFEEIKSSQSNLRSKLMKIYKNYLNFLQFFLFILAKNTNANDFETWKMSIIKQAVEAGISE